MDSKGNTILHDEMSPQSTVCLYAAIFTIRKQKIVSYPIKNSLKLKLLDQSLVLQIQILNISCILQSKFRPSAFHFFDCSNKFLPLMVNTRDFEAFSWFVLHNSKAISVLDTFFFTTKFPRLRLLIERWVFVIAAVSLTVCKKKSVKFFHQWCGAFLSPSKEALQNKPTNRVDKVSQF